MSKAHPPYSPREIDKEDLKSLEESITLGYNFRVSISHQLSDKKEKIIRNVDTQFKEFSRCMGIADNGVKVRPYLILVVDGTFECEYHGGRCNGEYDTDNNLVIVTYRAYVEKGSYRSSNTNGRTHMVSLKAMIRT